MTKEIDIERFLTSYPPQVRGLVLAARDSLAAALPGSEETLDESARVIGYGYGPGYKGLVCTLILSQTGAKIGIAHGAALPDPKHLMEGKGKVHRHVPLQTTADLKQPGLTSLIKTALAAWKERHEANG